MTQQSVGEARLEQGGRLDALDGLRTIAVFLVVLFHISAPKMAAGFIGVDMFFVLSGYLITSGLIAELRRKGRIDLGRFWSRRIKRLMPAALLTIGTVLVVTVATAPKFQWRLVGGDAWWTLLYLANWRFIGSASYFADDGVEKPLLHMWSLAVEEQFYLVWPLLLSLLALGVGLVLRAWRSRLERATDGLPTAAEAVQADAVRAKAITIATMIVSALLIAASAYALAVMWRSDAPERAYMGTDTKAFEPLLGAFVACLVTFEPVKRFARRFALPLALGGSLVTAACFAVSKGPSAAYFGWAAFVFCLGTAGMIVGLAYDQRGNWFSRLMAWAPVAYLGRISYGIYLWHWPYALWFGAAHAFSWTRALLVVALTIATAAASYHLIEMPIRRGVVADWLGVGRTFAAGGMAMVVFAVSAAVVGGTPLQPVVSEVVQAASKETLDSRVVLFVGDSVPQRAMPHLANAGKTLGLTVVGATAGGCTPLSVDVKISDDPVYGVIPCDMITPLMADGLRQYTPGVVVWWSRYELADRFALGASDPKQEVLVAGTPEFWAAQERALRQQVELLTKNGAILVFVATDPPGVGMNSRCTPTDCNPFLDRLLRHDEIRQRWNSILESVVASDRRTRLVRVDDIICRDQAVPCDDVWNGSTIRPDGSHFTEFGGELMAPPLMTRILNATR